MKRKGITPVIAIVLLMLITVGAVGVVYTQFEEITDRQADLDFLEDMDIRVQSTVLESDGNMEITLENNDNEQVNLTETARLEYSVEGEGRVGPTTFETVSGYAYEGGECLEQGNADYGAFEPGDIVTCDTGVEMADPGDPITVYLIETGSGDVVDSTTCSPSTSSSSTC